MNAQPQFDRMHRLADELRSGDIVFRKNRRCCDALRRVFRDFVAKHLVERDDYEWAIELFFHESILTSRQGAPIVPPLGSGPNRAPCESDRTVGDPTSQERLGVPAHMPQSESEQNALSRSSPDGVVRCALGPSGFGRNATRRDVLRLLGLACGALLVGCASWKKESPRAAPSGVGLNNYKMPVDSVVVELAVVDMPNDPLIARQSKGTNLYGQG